MRLKILALIFVAFLMIIGCARTDLSQRNGLDVSMIMTGIGPGEDISNFEIQRLSYTITLANYDKSPAFVKEIALNLTPAFKDRLISQELTKAVNKEIASNSSIEIKGFLDFSAKGLTKDQIDSINPKIESIKVTNEQVFMLKSGRPE